MSDIPSGYTLTTAGAKQGSMVLRKINCPLDNPVVIHFYKVAFPDFLVFSDEIFAMGASDLQDMAAPNFPTIWVFIDFHEASASLFQKNQNVFYSLISGSLISGS